MADNEQIMNEEVTPSPEEVLVKMKETMVPKEEANKWQKKYNDLFQSVANGSFSGEDNKPHEKTEAEKKADFENNIRKLGDASNRVTPLEMFQTMVDIDDYLTSHGQRSGFAPTTGEITEDIANSCEKTRELLQTIIEKSEGSDSVALAMFDRYLTEPAGFSQARNSR